jgi:uncharacterized SAM-binding protein YcdF (DUF218 family)
LCTRATTIDSVSLIKFVSLLIYPVGFIALLVCFGVICRILGLRKTSVTLWLLATIAFFAASNPILSDRLLASLENRFPQLMMDQIPNGDVILVLGGGLRLPIAPRQVSQLTNGSDRYWLAAQLFKSSKAPQIVLSGGNVFEQAGMQSESYYAKQLLNQWGVPLESIVIEGSSRTTAQNANFTRQAIDSPDKVILLVTSAWHMPRSLKEFSLFQASIVPVSADVVVDQSQAPNFYRYIPSSTALIKTRVALHEYYGMWYSELKKSVNFY